MRIAYKFRLYPSSAQRTRLEQTLDLCRWVWNQTLALRKDAWEQEQRRVSYFETKRMLPVWKAGKPELNGVHSQVLQNVTQRVDLAFQAFFRRLQKGEAPGYPRFKGKGWYDSFTYTQSGFSLLDNGRLHLSKIGDVKVKLHRAMAGAVKTLIIRRDTLGNWYACFSCETEQTPLEPLPHVVSVDVGIHHFATFSTGAHIENPRFFRRDEKALAKTQRAQSKAEGTPDFARRKRVVQHIHERIANRRRDFAHKLSRRLVNDNQVIVFEDLDILEMKDQNGTGMNKSIGDVAWGQLVQYTSYKAESAGRMCLLVDPRNTTKACSSCAELVPKARSQRVHACPPCGLVLDRDVNAALNILARGLASINPGFPLAGAPGVLEDQVI
jgi:putative transposase